MVSQASGHTGCMVGVSGRRTEEVGDGWSGDLPGSELLQLSTASVVL